MTTKFNVAVVEHSCAEKYMKALKIIDEITPDMVVKDGRVFHSVEQYNGIRSAIAWVYKVAVARVEMPFAQDLGTYINNMPRCCSKATTRSQAHEEQRRDEIRSIRDNCRAFESGEKDIFNHLMLLLD